MSIQFAIWLPIAIIQITLFSYFLIKNRSNFDEKQDIDLVSIVVYNDFVYWQENNNLLRAQKRNNGINPKTINVIDMLNSDLLPSEIMHIIEELEKVD
jgi:hypothetical protein